MINTFTELKERIKDDKKLLVIRFGNVEVTDLLMDTIYPQMYSNAGFYCKEGDLNKVYSDYKNRYVKAIFNSDCMLDVFTCSSFQIIGDLLVRLNVWKPSLPYMEDPGWWWDNIIDNMTGTIGIISYFKDDIEKQLKVIDKVWNKKISKNFIIIKSHNTITGNDPHNNWSETYKHLEADVDRHKEVNNWLVSCGCYGLPICDYICSTGTKKVIYIGGLLQLLFGLKGKRWDNRKEVNKYYNKHWKYPSIKPVNGSNVEDWCYGK